jgi:hypothetical protein
MFNRTVEQGYNKRAGRDNELKQNMECCRMGLGGVFRREFEKGNAVT